MKYILILLSIISAPLLYADSFKYENTFDEYKIVTKADIDKLNIPGEFFKRIKECQPKSLYSQACASMYLSEQEDIVLVDMCSGNDKFKKGFYQFSRSSGEYLYSEWFDPKFMEWACQEVGEGGLKYYALRNDTKGFWDILLIDYHIYQSAGYYVIKIKDGKMIILDHEKSDLT